MKIFFWLSIFLVDLSMTMTRTTNCQISELIKHFWVLVDQDVKNARLSGCIFQSTDRSYWFYNQAVWKWNVVDRLIKFDGAICWLRNQRICLEILEISHDTWIFSILMTFEKTDIKSENRVNNTMICRKFINKLIEYSVLVQNIHWNNKLQNHGSKSYFRWIESNIINEK